MVDEKVVYATSYYSSDEDVAWGPITLREIKSDLKRVKKVKPHYRRQTLEFVPTTYVAPKMLKATNSSLSSNVEYYTADETIESDINPTNRKENNPPEQTHNCDSPRGFNLTPSNVSSINVQEIISLSSDDNDDDEGLGMFYVKPEETSRCSKSSYVTSSSAQANVDVISVISDDDQELETSRDSGNNGIHSENASFSENYESNSKDLSGSLEQEKEICEAICEENKFEGRSIPEIQIIPNTPSRNPLNTSEYSDISAIDSSPKHKQNLSLGSSEDFEYNIEDERSNIHPTNFEDAIDSSTKNKENFSLGSSEDFEYNIEGERSNIHPINPEDGTSSSDSNVGSNDSEGSAEQVNEALVQTSFNNSSDFNGSYTSNASGRDSSDVCLDNTMDDLENLLRDTLETSNDNNIIENTPNARSRIPTSKSHFTSSSSISNNCLQEVFKVPQISSRIVKTTPSSSKILTPNKKLLTLKKSSPNKFKDIISPVRLYINNSPLPVLKQAHKPRLGKENHLGDISENPLPPPKIHKKILGSLPEIIYKPSATVFEKIDSRIILPKNILKLIKERVVIKHEVRERVNMNKSLLSTREKLNRGNLSYIASEEWNVSMHTAKQGFKL